MKKRLKKTFALILCTTLLCAALSGCGKESKEEISTNNEEIESIAGNETDEKVSPEAGEETCDDGKIREELTALEVVELMGGGINLGNTMEATEGRKTHGVGADPVIYETGWGQPVTTQAMLDGMKAAGLSEDQIAAVMASIKVTE